MKWMVFVLMVFPGLVMAQAVNDDYTIYSAYLQQSKNSRKDKANLVVRTSIDTGYNYQHDIGFIADDMRGFLKHNASFYGKMLTLDESFVDILKSDTLWIGLIYELNRKIKNKFVIENRFSPNLDVTMISERVYDKCFKNQKDYRKIWKRFYRRYPKPSVLIELSEIANDGRRAVFYFSDRWDGLGGGSLVLFYNESGEWKFLQIMRIWSV